MLAGNDVRMMPSFETCLLMTLDNKTQFVYDSGHKRSVSELICGAEHESGTREGVSEEIFRASMSVCIPEGPILNIKLFVRMTLLATSKIKSQFPR